MEYARPIPIPTPVLGLNKKDARFSLDPSYCEWALNWEPEEQICKVRRPYWRLDELDSDTNRVMGMASFNNKLLAYVDRTSGNHVIYEVDATSAVVHTTGGATSTTTNPFAFAGRICFPSSANGTNEARVSTDGTTWSAFGFTFGGTVINAFTGITYKGSVYLTTGNMIMYVGGSSAVTGACTEHDLSTLFSRSQALRWFGVLSSKTQQSEEQYFVIGSASGEILIYAGDHPDALNWEQIAKFDLGDGTFVTDSRAVIQLHDDILIAHSNGLVSLKKLAQPLEDQNDIYLSKNIGPYWRKLLRASADDDAQYCRPPIAYWPERQQIYVLVNGFLDKDNIYHDMADGNATMLVYNMVSKAWQVQKVPVSTAGIGGYADNMIYHANNIYYSTGKAIMCYDSTETLAMADENPDTGAEELYTIQLYGSNANYQQGVKKKTVQGFDLLIETDFTGATIGFKSAADFGRKISAASTQLYPAAGNSNPFYNVGVDGNFVQYRIEGTSEAASIDGFKLFSIGVSLT